MWRSIIAHACHGARPVPAVRAQPPSTRRAKGNAGWTTARRNGRREDSLSGLSTACARPTPDERNGKPLSSEHRAYRHSERAQEIEDSPGGQAEIPPLHYVPVGMTKVLAAVILSRSMARACATLDERNRKPLSSEQGAYRHSERAQEIEGSPGGQAEIPPLHYVPVGMTYV